MRDTEPLALPATTVDALRDEVTRLTTELEKYVGHEPTIAEEMAHLRAELDRLEQEAENVTEYRYFIPGHPLGEHAYIAARTLGDDKWAVMDDTLTRISAYTTQHEWRPVAALTRAHMYPWTREQAKELAQELAADTAERPTEPEAVASC